MKDPDDDFETYGFTCEDDEVCFDPGINEEDIPELDDDCQIYCEKCTWKGKYNEIKK
jgi:hypothetical protein